MAEKLYLRFWSIIFSFSQNVFNTVYEIKFSVRDLFSKCECQFSADLFTFTKEMLNGKLFCAV